MSWDSTKKNPWGLTDSQCATLRAVADLGCTKLAARQLGLAGKTIEQHIRNAKQQMGMAHRTQAVVAFDRHVRAQAANCALVLVDRDLTINGTFVPAGNVYKLAVGAMK